MSRMKGPPVQNLRNFTKRLQQVPRVAAIEMAKRAAPIISGYAQATFDAGQDVYGAARRLGVHGNALSLKKKNDAARASLLFTSDGGTKIRAVLARAYVKFLIGKYKILPIGNAALPMRWQLALNTLAAEVLARIIGVEPGSLRRAA